MTTAVGDIQDENPVNSIDFSNNAIIKKQINKMLKDKIVSMRVGLDGTNQPKTF